MFDGSTQVRSVLHSLLDQRERCTQRMEEMSRVISNINRELGYNIGEQSPYVEKWWMAKKAWDFYKECSERVAFSEEFV